MFQPLAPQCPVLAGHRPRHLRRAITKGATASGVVPIPVEVETPRPSLSTVTVGNKGLRWSELTGRITVEDVDDDGSGPEEGFELRPGDPVVLRYDGTGQIFRSAAGRERRLPTLLGRRTIDAFRDANGFNPDTDVYCGLMYAEQAMPVALKQKTLLVLVAGHQAVSVPWGDELGWEQTNVASRPAGAPATWRGLDRVPLGVWLTPNTLYLEMPGRINHSLRQRESGGG